MRIVLPSLTFEPRICSGAFPLFHPLLHGRQLLERVAALASAAMVHARDEEQPDGLPPLAGTHFLQGRVVVGHDLRGVVVIRPADVDHQLSATIHERLEVGIRTHVRIDDPVGQGNVAVEVHRPPIPAGILVHRVRVQVHRVGMRLLPGEPGQLQLAPHRGAREYGLPGARVDGTGVDLPHQVDLGSRQAIGTVRPLAEQLLGIETAAVGFLDQAVVHPDRRGAGFQRGLVDHRVLGLGDEPGRLPGDQPGRPDLRGVEERHRVGRRSGNDAVVVLGEPPRLHHRLHPPQRAADEVRVLRGGTVVGPQDGLGRDGHLVDGPVAVVDQLLGMAGDEAAACRL